MQLPRIANPGAAPIIGELTARNPGMADLLIELEEDDELRARFDLELLRG